MANLADTTKVMVYKNKLYRQKYKFGFIGIEEEFTLTPGKYLISCHGAPGGASIPAEQALGGVTYGVLDLDETKTLYACVGGGSEENVIDHSIVGFGGFNCGSHGLNEKSQYHSSIEDQQSFSGGGATDIRTKSIASLENNGDYFANTKYIKIVCNEVNGEEKPDYISIGSFRFYDLYNSLVQPISVVASIKTSSIVAPESASVWRGRPENLGTGNVNGGYYQYDLYQLKPVVSSKYEKLVLYMTFEREFYFSRFLFRGGVSGESPTSMDVYCSEDNTNWTLVKSLRNIQQVDDTQWSSTFYPDNYQSVRRPFGRSNKVRIRVTRTQNSASFRMNEIQFFGSDGENPLPISNAYASKSDTEIVEPSYASGQKIDKIIDNKTSTYMQANRSNTTDILNMYFEFDDVYDIYSYRMHTYSNPNYFMHDWEIYLTDDDGETWYKVCGVIGNYTDGSSTYNTWTSKYYSNIYNNLRYNVLLSRIMVASGGGGAGVRADYIIKKNYSIERSCGGGVYSGFYDVAAQSTSSDSSTSYKLTYCDQSSSSESNGFSSFGRANFPGDFSGSGGGGGGWFGGPTNQTSTKSQNGVGGNCYVLTDNSYKPPYYSPDESLHFTDPLMLPGISHEACAEVYEEITMGDINDGDTIIFPQVGWEEHIELPTGKYVMKCYGGDGGTVNDFVTKTSNGGYTSGHIELRDSLDLYVNVGGNGMMPVPMCGSLPDCQTMATIANPVLGYNGGGISKLENNRVTFSHGGGATDFRLRPSSATDSLYSRIMVAGGSGGLTKVSTSSTPGGVGGGGTGGDCVPSSAYPSNNYGPGTQTASGTGSQTKIEGGFGFGGGGYMTASGYYPSSYYSGSGGGGWFGGSGSTTGGNSTSTKGTGAGGSGYVVTDTSYKPDGYLVPDTIRFTNVVNVAGGSTLPRMNSQAEIYVETKSINVKYITEDEEGLKYYDSENETWALIPGSPELTEELFEEYGGPFENDTGLLEEYDVYVYDPEDNCEALELTYCPNTVTVSKTINTNIIPAMQEIIADCSKPDEFSYSMDCVKLETSNDRSYGYYDKDTHKIVHNPDASTATNQIRIDIKIDKLTANENTDSLKIYGCKISSR